MRKGPTQKPGPFVVLWLLKQACPVPAEVETTRVAALRQARHEVRRHEVQIPSPAMDLASAAARGADTIHQAFDEHHQCLRSITRRVRRRFEERDWDGIRRDTVEKLDLPSRSVSATVETLGGQLGERLADRAAWAAM